MKYKIFELLWSDTIDKITGHDSTYMLKPLRFQRNVGYDDNSYNSFEEAAEDLRIRSTAEDEYVPTTSYVILPVISISG